MITTKELLILCVLLLVCAIVHAEAEVKVSAPDGTIANLVLLPTPTAGTCAAVNDSLSLLAVGLKHKTGPHLHLYPLDAQGQPAAPVAVTLPRPPALAEATSYPLGLAFHPKLPRLYVWQDVDVPNTHGVPNDPAACKDFDHLLIYDLGTSPPSLVQSLGRGRGYAIGVKAGALALNATATRLYVPNLLPDMERQAGYSCIGYFELDAEGKPVGAEPRRKTPYNAYGFSYPPAGAGFVPLDKDVVIAAGGSGPVTWNENNKRAPFNTLMLLPFSGLYSVDRIAGHPSHPVVYQATVNTPWIASAEHVDGYLTQLPQRFSIEKAHLTSLPLVMARRNQVAFGGANKVYVVDLDDQGRFKPTLSQAVVANPGVAALAYSPKFDRLYVTVEKAK
jgi:hypothetical protein